MENKGKLSSSRNMMCNVRVDFWVIKVYIFLIVRILKVLLCVSIYLNTSDIYIIVSKYVLKF